MHALPADSSSGLDLMRFVRHPTFLNIHFIAGVLICTTVMTYLSVTCSGYYDSSVVRHPEDASLQSLNRTIATGPA